jgi:hypothetical protein
VVGVGESDALDDLVRAHEDLQRLTGELADARERRRLAAQRLIDSGRSLAWIAGRLGVTRQAVDGFLKYKDRKNIRS